MLNFLLHIVILLRCNPNTTVNYSYTHILYHIFLKALSFIPLKKTRKKIIHI